MRTKGSVLMAFAAMLLVAACSSGGSGGGPAPLLEKSDVIAQGDAVCKLLSADVKQLTDAFRSAHPTVDEASVSDFFVNTLLPRYDKGVGDIHRIGEPTKDRVGFDDAVRALDKGLTQLKEEIGADPVKVLTSSTTAFDKANGLFVAYGFKECGKK